MNDQNLTIEELRLISEVRKLQGIEPVEFCRPPEPDPKPNFLHEITRIDAEKSRICAEKTRKAWAAKSPEGRAEWVRKIHAKP